MVYHDVYNLHLRGWRKMKVEPGANEVLQQRGRTRGQWLSGGMRASAPADEWRWGFAGQLVGRWRFRMIGEVVLAVTKQ